MTVPEQDVETPHGPSPGLALCLSGGGYRAMVFHLGALMRLNEAGLLSKISRISSVSGGSIVAAYLGLRWKDLSFDSGGRAKALGVVVENVRRMASTDVDTAAVIGGVLLPGTIADRVAKAYDEVLFNGATLAELPDDASGPRFVINSTNVQSGALWRFSRPYMGDYRVGLVRNPTVKLAIAVAASSAFPPVLSPLVLNVADSYDPASGGDLSSKAFREQVALSDGGVYDNLGLEPAYKRYGTLLVSDGGLKIAAEEAPHHDWARHSMRILDVIDNQVRSLRKRQLIDAFQRKERTGAYWGIRTSFSDYGLPSDPLGCGGRDATSLASVPTRLHAMPPALQERLINWGYAITDAALRTHFGTDLQGHYGVMIGDPQGFPYAGCY